MPPARRTPAGAASASWAGRSTRSTTATSWPPVRSPPVPPGRGRVRPDRPAVAEGHRSVSPAEDRYLMTVIATAANPAVLRQSHRHRPRRARPTPWTPCATCAALNPDTDLFFITGADALGPDPDLAGRRGAVLLAHFIGVTRPGHVAVRPGSSASTASPPRRTGSSVAHRAAGRPARRRRRGAVPAATPVAEIHAIAADAGAMVFVSAEARPDLAGPEGTDCAVCRPAERSQCPEGRATPARDDDGRRRAHPLLARRVRPSRRHAHARVAACPSKGCGATHGLQEGERVWSTTMDGSVESVWLLLGAWHNGAEVVDVEQALEPEEWHKLLDRFRPAVVFLRRRVRGACVRGTGVVVAGSIRRALTSGDPTVERPRSSKSSAREPSLQTRRWRRAPSRL